MTAQEWLEELLRLSEAATPGPWDISQKNSTCYDDYGDSVCDTQQTHNSENSLAYIVAACNAVPKLVEMVQDMSCTMAGMPGMDAIPTEILQEFFDITEPEE